MKITPNTLCKLPATFVAGLFVTLLLFYFMQALVQVDDGPQQTLFITKIMDATVPEFEPELILKIDKPEPIEQPDIVEIPPDLTRIDITNGLSIPSTTFTIDTDIKPSATGTIPMSNIMIPLVRSTPNYPNRALSRGVEGFVDLSFTVSAQGIVQDPEVLYAEPEGYFERSALQTIRKWKYSPALDEGEAQATYDVRQRIVYQMSDN